MYKEKRGDDNFLIMIIIICVLQVQVENDGGSKNCEIEEADDENNESVSAGVFRLPDTYQGVRPIKT